VTPDHPIRTLVLVSLVLLLVKISVIAIGSLVGWMMTDLAHEAAENGRNHAAGTAAADEETIPPPNALKLWVSTVIASVCQAYDSLLGLIMGLGSTRPGATELPDDPLFREAEYQIMLIELRYPPIRYQNYISRKPELEAPACRGLGQSDPPRHACQVRLSLDRTSAPGGPRLNSASVRCQSVSGLQSIQKRELEYGDDPHTDPFWRITTGDAAQR
jgi:hypothetical protein